MSTTLTIEPEARFSIGRPSKFLFVLVGAGGTGSYLDGGARAARLPHAGARGPGDRDRA